MLVWSTADRKHAFGAHLLSPSSTWRRLRTPVEPREGGPLLNRMAVDEVRALLEEHGLADRLPGLISRWDSLADGNSIVALRHAEEEDLINAGFTEREAKDFLGALRASSPLGASRPASPDHADPEDFLRGRREQRLSARPQLPQTDHTEPEPEPAPLSGLGRASMRDSGAAAGAAHRVHNAPFRYTPVTAMSPGEFPSQYSAGLRLNAVPASIPLPTGREESTVEALIVITMYNEGADLLDETLDGICDNIAHDCKKSGDPDAWKRWAVCIVADGRQKMSKGVAEKDFYDANTAQLALEMARPGEEVRLHLFEGTRVRERPGVGTAQGKAHTICCCCKTRRPTCCCARKLEPEMGEMASESSVATVQSLAGRDSQRTTRERSGPAGDGQYRMGPSFIEHVPEVLDDSDPNESKAAACMRKCSSNCASCRRGTGQNAANGTDNNYYKPLQLIFAVKEENAGKLDSHLWFFDAFADSLQPDFCFLIDVGTKPGPRSLVKLRDTLKSDEKVAGVCGQMEIDPGKVERFNLLHAAQKFEYQLANLMDKSLESAFGFISVLPGAFSAYRYEALRCKKGGDGEDADDDVLTTYFSSINKKLGPKSDPDSLGPLKGNMFLAEDRILVFELLSWKGKDWFMRYVSSAHAYTDPVDSLEGLLKQRRRWSNGSFFAMLFTFESLPRFWLQSGHTLPRKLLITILFLYYSVMQLVGWFTLAIFYLCFKFIVEGTVHDIFGSIPSEVPHDYDSYSLLVFQCVDICVVTIIGLQVIAGLGNKPGYNDEEGGHTLALYVVAAQMLAVVTVFMYGSALFQLTSMWHFDSTGDGCTCNAISHMIDQDPCTNGTDPGDIWCPDAGPVIKCEVVTREDIGDQGCLTIFEKTLAVMTVGGPFVAAFLHKRLFSLLLVFPKYLLCMPVFTVMVPIYSFCNMHDISWGTKGLEAPIPLRERKLAAEIQLKMDRQLSVEPNGQQGVAAAAAAGGGAAAPQDLRQSMSAGRQDLQERRKIREQGEADQNKVKQDRAQTEDEFREFRTWVVSLWLVSNSLVIFLLSSECDEEAVFNERYGDKFSGGSYKIPGLCATTIARSPDTPMSEVFTRGILVLAGCINAFRLVGSTYFLLVDKLERWLLRPWSCGPCCYIERDPNRKRFIALIVGLLLFLGSAVAALVFFEDAERAKTGQGEKWTDRIGDLVDPHEDYKLFVENLPGEQQKIVMALGCVAVAGALCMLAAIGARPRFMRKRGEVLSSNFEAQSTMLWSAGDLPMILQEEIEAKLRRTKIWAGTAVAVSLLLLVWGGLFVAVVELKWLEILGMVMFVLGVVMACLAVSLLARLCRISARATRAAAGGGGGRGSTARGSAARGSTPLLTGDE